jgi:hypothetical protein
MSDQDRAAADEAARRRATRACARSAGVTRTSDAVRGGGPRPCEPSAVLVTVSLLLLFKEQVRNHARNGMGDPVSIESTLYKCYVADLVASPLDKDAGHEQLLARRDSQRHRHRHAL